MFSTLDEMYRSHRFPELNPLTAIANLLQPEHQETLFLLLQMQEGERITGTDSTQKKG